MAELFFYYNEVQNVILPLLFIDVLWRLTYISHGCLTTKLRWT